jgi:hypothetical protein
MTGGDEHHGVAGAHEHAPSACLASLPVSMEIVRDPIRISRFCRLTLCMCTFAIRHP